MVLLPKGRGWYKGIGLLEVIWKLCASIINNHLRSSVTLHDSLNGFRQGGGSGTATLEANLSQKLEGLFNDPLFHIFLDVRKFYDSLYRGRYM